MAELEVLQTARELISKGWTAGVYQTVRHGQECFCAVGALNVACRLTKATEKERLRAISLLAKEAGMESITRFNDGSTQQGVLALFNKAIEGLSK